MSELKQYVCGACQREWVDHTKQERCPYCGNRHVSEYLIRD